MRSPGCAWLGLMCAVTLYCIADECGSETPACAHAHIVSPEQSNPTPGSAAPQTYGVPITEYAALIAACALPFGAGGGPPGGGDTDGVAPVETAAACAAACASR